MPESWPPPPSVKDADEVSTTAGDYHNMYSLENASIEQDQDPSPGASLTAPSDPPSTEPQAAPGAPSATAAQGTQNIGTNPPMTIPLALESLPNGYPESGHAPLLNGAGLSQANLSTLPPSVLFTSSTPHQAFQPSLTATSPTSFAYTSTSSDGHEYDYSVEEYDLSSLEAAVPPAASQLPTASPYYTVNAEQLMANLISSINALAPNAHVSESQANVPTPSPGSLQEDMADENAATMPSVPTAENVEDLSTEMAHETSSSNTPAGMELPPGFLEYVLSFTITSGSSAARLQRPRFDPVAFVDSLERVNISDILAEDMRCAHCWLAFGTTDEDELGFVFTPDSDDPPELAARQVAFRELPFCTGRPDNDPVQTPCGHLFGRGCLIEIIEKMSTLCPTCRQEMRS